MKKKVWIWIVVTVILLSLGGAGLWLWEMFQAPLYSVGMVRSGQNLRAGLEPPAQKGEAGFFQVEEDIRLHTFSQGQGRNVLVVHGGPGVPFSEPLKALEPLAGQYRFVYYDQRGSGLSSRPLDTLSAPDMYGNIKVLETTLDVGAQIADIERIRRILGDEKLILVGHSFGGLIASLYAAEFPEHVAALILVSPAETIVMPAPSGGLFEQVRERLPENQLAAYDAYMKRYLDFNGIFKNNEAGLAAMSREFTPYYETAARAAGFDIPASNRGEQNGGWMVYGMYFSLGMKSDFRPALKQISVPALVIHGEKDLQPEEATRLYSDVLPSAELAVIPGAGHFSFHDQPQAFAGLVGEFLKRSVQP